MKEIGGYIELDTYHLPMLHEGAIELNCGRNCLAYLFKSRGIKKIKVPFFICDSIALVCDREGVEKEYYHIGWDFRPNDDLFLKDDEWLYLVNFYGQLNNEEIKKYLDKYKRVIVDQANNYYAKPIEGVDTLYTCRKWFGVSDGAFLYTDYKLTQNFQRDESFERMHFLLGRYERTATEFYSEYSLNNKSFVDEPIKRMSLLTRNLLHGIDYGKILEQRKRNYQYLDNRLRGKNILKLRPAEFMYPFMIEDGARIRKLLQKEKIYIPMLWPIVTEVAEPESIEYRMAENILPLPIDQRYSTEDMEYIIEKLIEVGGI